MTQCWWLYLLVCRDGRTYTGIAIDVAARLAAHSSGKGAKFTHSNPPVRVLGAQAFASKSEALKGSGSEETRPHREVGLGSEMCADV
jgi:putative endonuclease